MKYIPPGKPEFRSSKDDLLNGLISDLLFLDTRRRHKFLNFYTSEDPTLLEMLERPKGAMVLKAEDMEMDPHEWSFLGIYTSIESFLSLEFVDQLLIKDKVRKNQVYDLEAHLPGHPNPQLRRQINAFD